MNYTHLGRTGLKVSRLCLGTMNFGDVTDEKTSARILDEALEAVVAVDNTAVEVIEVGRRKTAAVELDHRADIRRDDRQDIHDHPLGLVAGGAEGLGDLEPLDDAQLLLAAGVDELAAELAAQGLEIDLGQQLLHGLGAHTGLEIVLILFAHVAVFLLAEQLLLLQRGEAGVGDPRAPLRLDHVDAGGEGVDVPRGVGLAEVRI